MNHCGRCHECGTELRIVLDGEEWCDACQQYRRYRAHGWVGAGIDSTNCNEEPLPAGDTEFCTPKSSGTVIAHYAGKLPPDEHPMDEIIVTVGEMDALQARAEAAEARVAALEAALTDAFGVMEQARQFDDLRATNVGVKIMLLEAQTRIRMVLFKTLEGSE